MVILLRLKASNNRRGRCKDQNFSLTQNFKFEKFSTYLNWPAQIWLQTAFPIVRSAKDLSRKCNFQKGCEFKVEKWRSKDKKFETRVSDKKVEKRPSMFHERYITMGTFMIKAGNKTKTQMVEETTREKHLLVRNNIRP